MALSAQPADARWFRIALAACVLVVTVDLVYQLSLWTMLDLGVYRRGGLAIVNGDDLYGSSSGLPFTYPPFAAVLFVPLSFVSVLAGRLIMTAVSLACYVAFTLLCARRTGLTWRAGCLVAVLGLAFEPVLHTIGLGQINLVLGLIVVVDCLKVSDRWRGLLVGLTIGIKLTPAVFVLLFAMRRDLGAVARAAAGFAATVVFAWVVDPHASYHYWTSLFFNPGHVGRVGYPFNQSLYGVLSRLFGTTSPPVALYALACVPVVALTVIACRRQLQAGRDVHALTTVAVGGLLISPISWTHHWIWLLPASMVLFVGGQRILGLAVAAVCVAAPLRYIPTPTEVTQLHLVWWQTLISVAYTTAGAAFLASSALSPPARQGFQSAPRHVHDGLA